MIRNAVITIVFLSCGGFMGMSNDGAETAPALNAAERTTLATAAGGEPTPPKPAVARTRMAGCVASGDGKGSASDGAKERSGGTGPTRSGLDEVSVTPRDGGIRIAHHLTHLCCLKAEVKTDVDGRTVEVKATFTGTACRCICESTLTTDVDLRAGDYAVVVRVDELGKVRKAHEGKAVVAD